MTFRSWFREEGWGWAWLLVLVALGISIIGVAFALQYPSPYYDQWQVDCDSGRSALVYNLYVDGAYWSGIQVKDDVPVYLSGDVCSFTQVLEEKGDGK